MKRARLKTRNTKRATANRTPLAEGVIQFKKNGQRDWKTLSDDGLISFAKKFLKENGIRGRSELFKADVGLYKVLKRRVLLDRVGFEEKRRKERHWNKMKDEELIKYAKKFMKEKGIGRRSELSDADRGLHNVLRKRGLLDKVGFEEKRRSWNKMEDKEIIGYAKKFMDENGIGKRGELSKTDNGLYTVLRERKLLDKIGFEGKQRSWKGVGDEELIEFAKRFLRKKGINGRKELQKADKGLYSVLRKRKLLDEIGLENMNKHHRDWASVADGELVQFAKRFVKKNGIIGRKEFDEMDTGLYQTLKNRGLRDRIGLKDKRGQRKVWASKDDGWLVEFAKRFMQEKGIRRRHDLEKAIKGLYKILSKRNLLGKLDFETVKRTWAEISDEELITYAKTFLKENGIRGRHEFEKTDKGLYNVLKRRKLLNLVFSDIEQSKQQENERNRLLALSQAVEAMEAFGERR